MNPLAAHDYPYDPDNPFRTETQRINAMGPEERAAYEAKAARRDAVSLGILLPFGLLLAALIIYLGVQG